MLPALRTITKLIQYETSILPAARREIRRWASAAASIPDPTLRTHATYVVTTDAGNAEAIAAFAAIAPRASRRATVELLTTYQILVDYVDAVGEHVCADRLLQGLALGLALAAALATPHAPLDLDPLGDDGGFLAALVSTCRDGLWQLPSAAAVAEAAGVAAVRCAHALAHTHAAMHTESLSALRGWAARQPGTSGYAWWEVAAGANSNIAIPALLAAAADPATTARDAAAIAAAYWPHVCALSTLLDSLVDYERDTVSGNFSFVSHYPEDAAIERGLTATATRSLTAVLALRHRHTHTMIVCGVAGYYATAGNGGTLAARIAPHVLARLRPSATPIIAALRAQHGAQRLHDDLRRGASGVARRLRAA